MENNSNIIDYVRESVLPKVDQQKHEAYILLSKAFEEMGDSALYLSHTEIGRNYKKKLTKLETQYLVDGGVPDAIDLDNFEILSADIGLSSSDKAPLDYVNTEISQFTKGELLLLSNKDNWFGFLGNAMIKHFINKVNDQLNEVNVRKKMQEIINHGGKTVDISAIKLLGNSSVEDEGTYYTTTVMMPRWNVGQHHNGGELLQKFNKEILSHLEIDGYSTNMSYPEEETEDDKVQAQL